MPAPLSRVFDFHGFPILCLLSMHIPLLPILPTQIP
jgi:hypothetical protein